MGITDPREWNNLSDHHFTTLGGGYLIRKKGGLKNFLKEYVPEALVSTHGNEEEAAEEGEGKGGEGQQPESSSSSSNNKNSKLVHLANINRKPKFDKETPIPTSKRQILLQKMMQVSSDLFYLISSYPILSYTPILFLSLI